MSGTGGSSRPCATLRNGLAWPLLGLGTYRLTPLEMGPVLSSVSHAGALSGGFIDTAVSYRFSHGAISEALTSLDTDGDSKPLWIQTKIPPRDQGYDRARACALRCVDELGGCAGNLCVLLHWPGASRLPPASPEHARLRLGSWLALQELYKAGTLQAIGVSNFDERHLLELCHHHEVDTMPLVNQIECHPFLQQRALRATCAQRGIHVQAYSSLGQGSERLLQHPAVQAAARRRGATSAQVLLVWAMQQGISVLPRSANPKRVGENRMAVHLLKEQPLDEEEMEVFDRLEDGTKFCWDPKDIA